MADNVQIPATGSGDATPTVATEKIAGVDFQKVKLIDATAGSTTGTGTSANPLRTDPTGTTRQPVSLPSTTVSGTVAVSSLPPIIAFISSFPSTQPVSGTVNVGNPTVFVSSFPSTQPVSGTVTALPAGTQTVFVASYPSTQPVSGTIQTSPSGIQSITGAVAVASTVTVSGTVAISPTPTVFVSSFPSTQTVTGNVTTGAHTVFVSSFPSTQAITGSGTAGTPGSDVFTTQGPSTAVGIPQAVGNRQVSISVTPTISTSPAYTSGDAVGGLLTFANAVRAVASSATIQGVVVSDATTQAAALDLVLFNQTFTASTDNAVFNPKNSDLLNNIGVIPISNYATFSANGVATRFGLAFPIVLQGTSLFGQLVTRGTPTYSATSNLQVMLDIFQD